MKTSTYLWSHRTYVVVSWSKYTFFLCSSYYTKGFDGPNRESIETEDPQQKLQTAQYGSRNDAWIGIDEAKSEIEYLQSEKPPLDLQDLKTALMVASKAFKDYISLAPPDQVEAALKQIVPS